MISDRPVPMSVRRNTARTRATSSLGLNGLVRYVVGAKLEPYEFVALRDPGSQHYDRHVRVLPQCARDIKTVDVRQSEVEDDEVRLPAAGQATIRRRHCRR